MLTAAADVLFVLLVAVVAAMPTGHLAADRGWFPGGEEDKPAPVPEPEEGQQ